jgi:hypothetical protein
MALREPIGDPREHVYLVTDEDGALCVAYDPSEPFSSMDPMGVSVCLSEPNTALDALHELRAAVDRAIANLTTAGVS